MDRKPSSKPPVMLGDRIGYRSWIVTITSYQYKRDGYDADGVEFSVPGDKLPWAASFDHMERMTGRKFDKPKKTPQPKPKQSKDQGMENIERIQIGMLRRSPKNVRKSNLDEDREKLVADIRTRGLLQNLIGVHATEDGKPVVLIHGGGRRMDALTHILDSGLTITVDGVDVPADQYKAPVRIFPTDEDAEEASLMENIQRVNMTAVDQYRAWSVLMTREGLTTKRLAQRTGQDQKYVERVLALGRLEPSILDQVAAGKLDWDAAKALTLAGSHERQLAVLTALSESTTRYNPTIQAWEIRKALTEDKVAGNSALGHFIREDYARQNLPVTQDLFSDQTSVILDDAKSARMLAVFKLMAMCETLKRQGWSWASWHLTPADARSHTFTYEQPEIRAVLSPEDEADKLRLIQANEEILEKYPAPDVSNDWEGSELDWTDEDAAAYNDNEAEIALIDKRAKPDWTPEQRARLGCFVSIGHDGGFHIQPGFRPKDDNDGRNDKGTVLAHGATVIPDHAGEKEDENAGMSAALMADLSAQRTLALQDALKDKPDVALSLLLYTLWGKVQCRAYIATPSNLSASLNLPTSTKTDTRTGEAAKSLDDRAGDFAFLKGKTGPTLFLAIHGMTAKERASLMAYLVARTVDAPMAPATARNPIAELIGGMLKVNVRDTWTPTEDEFWSRVSKTWIEENAPPELSGGIRLLAGEKKAGRVATLHKWFRNPEAMRMTDIGLKQDKPLEAKRVKAIAAWLPPGMAFVPPAVDQSAEVPDKGDEDSEDSGDLEEPVALAS